MIVLCILALVWLGIRVATTWRMCARAAEGRTADHDTAEWGFRKPQDAWRPAPEQTTGPQDAPPGLYNAATDDGGDVWAPTRAALIVLGREVARALAVSADRWAASVKPVQPELPAAEQTVSETGFFAVPRPAGGPAYLGGREDGAYLRGWDDAVDWISDSHDAAAPTWGGVAYMTGWDDAVRAIAKARVG